MSEIYIKKEWEEFISDDSILKIEELNDWITTLIDLETKSLEESKINPNTKLYIPTWYFIRLWKNLSKKYWRDIDPIKYIIQLYYKNNLSIESVWSELRKYWFEYDSHDSFWRFLKRTLGWKLKDKSKNQKTNRVIDKIPTSAIEFQQKKADEERHKLLLLWIKGTQQIDSLEFNLEEYLSKWEIWKMEYLFKIHCWLDLVKYIKESWVWVNILLSFLQEKINDITRENNYKEIKLSLYKLREYIKKIEII